MIDKIEPTFNIPSKDEYAFFDIYKREGTKIIKRMGWYHDRRMYGTVFDASAMHPDLREAEYIAEQVYNLIGAVYNEGERNGRGSVRDKIKEALDIPL